MLKRLTYGLVLGWFVLVATAWPTAAQSLHHTRDLGHVLSPETLGKGAISIQGFGGVQDANFRTSGGLAFGLGEYVDATVAFRSEWETVETREYLALGVKISDPPFLSHHLGLFPSARIPLADDERPLFGLQFMHVVEPGLNLPTKLYLNYGYFTQDTVDETDIFANRDYLEGGLGAKIAFSRSVLFAEFNLQTYLDFDAASFSESRFSANIGTRLAIGWGTSLSVMGGYDFSGQDDATPYVPADNSASIAVGVTRLFFPISGQVKQLQALLVEQMDHEVEEQELTALRARYRLFDRDLEALKQLLNDYQTDGGQK